MTYVSELQAKWDWFVGLWLGLSLIFGIVFYLIYPEFYNTDIVIKGLMDLFVGFISAIMIEFLRWVIRHY